MTPAICGDSIELDTSKSSMADNSCRGDNLSNTNGSRESNVAAFESYIPIFGTLLIPKNHGIPEIGNLDSNNYGRKSTSNLSLM